MRQRMVVPCRFTSVVPFQKVRSQSTTPSHQPWTLSSPGPFVQRATIGTVSRESAGVIIITQNWVNRAQLVIAPVVGTHAALSMANPSAAYHHLVAILVWEIQNAAEGQHNIRRDRTAARTAPVALFVPRSTIMVCIQPAVRTLACVVTRIVKKGISASCSGTARRSTRSTRTVIRAKPTNPAATVVFAITPMPVIWGHGLLDQGRAKSRALGLVHIAPTLHVASA